MKKEDIIEHLLMHGASIRIPYKSEIDDWYEDPTALCKRGEKYVIYGDGDREEFDTLEEALESMANEHTNNVGAIQSYIGHTNPDLDMECDWDEIKRLVSEEQDRRGCKGLGDEDD